MDANSIRFVHFNLSYTSLARGYAGCGRYTDNPENEWIDCMVLVPAEKYPGVWAMYVTHSPNAVITVLWFESF